jgi:diguanylate cyclase (GGDEF)-like protein/PAS domain S-box-containing protein
MDALLYLPAGDRWSLARRLAERGHRCDVRRSLEDAWEAWRAARQPLVVIDADHRQTGLELCRRIRSESPAGPQGTGRPDPGRPDPGRPDPGRPDPGRPDPEILVLVGRSPAAAAFVDAGASDVLKKPFGEERLELRLRLAAERRRRRRTETALEVSEERYRGLFEGVPVGIYRLSAEGELLDFNRAAAELLGGGDDPRRLLGYDTSRLYVDPEDRLAWRTLMQYEGEVPNFEAQIRRLDGGTIWVRSNAHAVRDAAGEVVAYEGTVEDVTDRRRLEDALKESDERFRSLVQGASDMISILDADRAVRYQSPSTIRLLGFSADERIGSNGFERVHPEDRPHLETLFEELLGRPGDSVVAEYRIRHGDGAWRFVESKITNLLGHPAVRGMVLNSRDVSDRKQAEAKLVHDALHDALTGLPNRALFMDRLGHCLDRIPRRRQYRCAVLFLDLDRFKMVNDSFGHAIGDLLLIEAGRRLRKCLRPSDTLARLGGDEFAILLDEVSDASNAVRVAQRIADELEAPFELRGREVYSSGSTGIALSTPATASGEELLRDADTAMYRAKGRGRAGYAIFDARMHAQVRSQLQLETDLRRALDEEQFEVFYQPIVILQTGGVAGFEALVRWHHPRRGVLDAASFVALAEDTGLIVELGRRVLRRACRQVKAWNDRRAGRRPLFVAVNLSPRQLTRNDLMGDVVEALSASGLDGDRLHLELSEGALIEDPEALLAILLQLRQLGPRFSLDDFGTGHSSLAVLHRFPFDQVKIDRGFVHNVGVDPGSDELMEGVLALCHRRRLKTVAEGVETEEQRSKLAELDCTYAQGYLFSRAVDGERAEEFLAGELAGSRG